MTKKITGRNLCSEKMSGNDDCKINDIAANIIPLVGKHVHAVRVEDEITEIKQDIMYIYPRIDVNLRVISSVDTVLDSNAPGFYNVISEHINKNPGHNEFCNMSRIRLVNKLPAYNAIAIKINGSVAGYYLPDVNSWLTGFWTWHIHYINVILSQIYPQIVEQLKMKTCPNAINSCELKRIIVSMGTDPELEVLRNGKVVNAQSVLECENHPLSSEIGLDGQQSQLEFRPKPGSPREVIKNIRQLVKTFAVKYPNFDLSDAGNRYPLGGHIHVGVGQEIYPSNELRMILDDFIGKPTIEMSGDARSSYKRLGAVREQNHGFEYRTTPSAVFQNPAIAYIALRLVKNLCEKYLNQEVLEYNDKPTLQDYITCGGLTKNQAKYFMKFCANYKPTQSIRAGWKVPAAPVSLSPVFDLAVEFRDDWDRGASRGIEIALQSSGIETTRPILISLYGLSSDRGENRCTVEVSNCRVLPIESIPKPLWQNDTLNIGFSLEIRIGGIRSTQVNDLIRGIRTALTLRGVLA